MLLPKKEGKMSRRLLQTRGHAEAKRISKDSRQVCYTTITYDYYFLRAVSFGSSMDFFLYSRSHRITQSLTHDVGR
jgi:hypothetical protein